MKDEGEKRKAENDERPEGLRDRTRKFALRVIRMVSALPKENVAQVLGKQVLRSATSVGAHFREASRARSNAEFISKLEVALQELDETKYWLELLGDSGILKPERLSGLNQEVVELTAILVTVVRKVKGKRSGRKKTEG